MSSNLDKDTYNEGVVISVRGGIVDLYFNDILPPLNTLLWAGEGETVPIEIVAHMDTRRAKGIALTATAGIGRGDIAKTDGRSLNAPVGKSLLGRMFNVFGEPIDGEAPLKPLLTVPFISPPSPFPTGSPVRKFF